MPHTGHAENRHLGSDVISDVTDVTMTSSQLGIVTKLIIHYAKKQAGKSPNEHFKVEVHFP